MFFATTKAAKNYAEVEYPENAYLVFGKETAGLPEELLRKNLNRCVRSPMMGNLRSLNLSNSVAIIAYEALRQKGFEGFNEKGKFAQDK